MLNERPSSQISLVNYCKSSGERSQPRMFFSHFGGISVNYFLIFISRLFVTINSVEKIASFVADHGVCAQAIEKTAQNVLR